MDNLVVYILLWQTCCLLSRRETFHYVSSYVSSHVSSHISWVTLAWRFTWHMLSISMWFSVDSSSFQASIFADDTNNGGTDRNRWRLQNWQMSVCCRSVYRPLTPSHRTEQGQFQTRDCPITDPLHFICRGSWIVRWEAGRLGRVRCRTLRQITRSSPHSRSSAATEVRLYSALHHLAGHEIQCYRSPATLYRLSSSLNFWTATAYSHTFWFYVYFGGQDMGGRCFIINNRRRNCSQLEL